MFQQEFSTGHSIIHRLDPRLKVLLSVGFSIVTALLSSYPALMTAACAALALLLLARLPLPALARRLAVINAFLLFLWFTLPLTLAGTTPIHFGPVGIKPDGLLLALLVTLKSNVIIFAGIALLATCPAVEISRALSRLRVPAKIVAILLFMLRYLAEIQREYGWMKNAMALRGFKARTSLSAYRAYARLVGLLLVISYEKAEAVHAAMLCRGFDGRFYFPDERRLQPIDFIFAGALTTIIIFIALLQWLPTAQ